MSDNAFTLTVIKMILAPMLFVFLVVFAGMLIVKAYPHIETFYQKHLKKDKRLEYLWLWPDLKNIDIAQSVAKDSSNMVFLIAVSILIFMLFRISHHSVYSVIYALLFIVIGFGIRHFSRAAAIAGILLYCFIFINTILNHGVINSGIAFLFISAFINAARACFSCHKLKASDPNIQVDDV